jgi:glycosyltransferase involved in cell wall biosynthesis
MLFIRQTSVIYGSHNVESARLEDLKHPDIPLYKKLASRLIIPLLERVAVRYSDYVIAVSERDRVSFCKRYSVSSSKVFVIPSGTELQDGERLKDRQSIRSQYGIAEDDVCLVFHGTYGNYANREALSHIQSDILPEFQDADPPVSIVIAGNGMPGFNKDNIISVGFVPDLYSFLNAMDIAIVPLTSGSGTKLKIFDYMSIGLPIVATKKAMEGIDADSGTHAFVLDDVDSLFVDTVRMLIDEPHTRTEVGTNARNLIRDQYSWDQIGKKVRSMYGEIG